MGKPYKGKYEITQMFGENKEYYSKFNLKGHEGMDFGAREGDKRITAIFSGIVIEDRESENEHLNYGNCVRIWNIEMGLVALYGHFEENYVSVGNKIEEGQVIGWQGNSGKGTGAHLHISVYEVDEKCRKRHPNNGYAGCIDPQPYLV